MGGEKPSRPTVVWHITCSCIMLRFPFIISCLVYHVSCHEYFPGKCPTFTPMDGFDWDQFSNGIWFVTQKFATKSSCLTYEFKTDIWVSNPLNRSVNFLTVSGLAWTMNTFTLGNFMFPKRSFLLECWYGFL